MPACCSSHDPRASNPLACDSTKNCTLSLYWASAMSNISCHSTCLRTYDIIMNRNWIKNCVNTAMNRKHAWYSSGSIAEMSPDVVMVSAGHVIPIQHPTEVLVVRPRDYQLRHLAVIPMAHLAGSSATGLTLTVKAISTRAVTFLSLRRIKLIRNNHCERGLI